MIFHKINLYFHIVDSLTVTMLYYYQRYLPGVGFEPTTKTIKHVGHQ